VIWFISEERGKGLKDEDQLQSYFIRRMDQFITAQGRSLVGWTEIRQGGLTRSAVVMDYKGGAVESAR
jgi:hexosaminidase